VPRDAPDPPDPPNALWEWRRLPFNGADKPRRIFWQQVELPLLLQREHCDILHAWNYVAPIFCPIPCILTVQDLIALNRPRFAARVNRLHYRAVMPQSLRRAARVIVTTERTRREVLRRAPDAQIRVIPLGVAPIFSRRTGTGSSHSSGGEIRPTAAVFALCGQLRAEKKPAQLAARA
jgi:hypothetical protein